MTSYKLDEFVFIDSVILIELVVDFFVLAEELLLATVVFNVDGAGFNKVEKRLFVEKTIPLLKKLSKLDEPIINSFCFFRKKRLQEMQTLSILILCCETSETLLEF